MQRSCCDKAASLDPLPSCTRCTSEAAQAVVAHAQPNGKAGAYSGTRANCAKVHLYFCSFVLLSLLALTLFNQLVITGLPQHSIVSVVFLVRCMPSTQGALGGMHKAGTPAAALTLVKPHITQLAVSQARLRATTKARALLFVGPIPPCDGAGLGKARLSVEFALGARRHEKAAAFVAAHLRRSAAVCAVHSVRQRVGHKSPPSPWPGPHGRTQSRFAAFVSSAATSHAASFPLARQSAGECERASVQACPGS